MGIDRFDERLLEQMTGKGWVFAKTSAQELRMHDLWKDDRLVRDWRLHSATPKTRGYRWAYHVPMNRGKAAGNG